MLSQEKTAALAKFCIDSFQQSDSRRSLFVHNLDYYLRMHASRRLVNLRPIAFDFRAEYWHRPEVRLGIKLFDSTFSNHFYPPAKVRSALWLIADHLRRQRRSGSLNNLHGEGDYVSTDRFRHDVKAVRLALAQHAPVIPDVNKDTRTSEDTRATPSVLQKFDDTLSEIEQADSWAAMDTVFFKRISYLHYFTAATEGALYDDARFFVSWYTMLTSINAYQQGAGRQIMGPIYGNSKTGDLVDVVNRWCDGQDLRSAPFVALGRSSDTPADRSKYMAVLELYAFSRLSEIPIMNKSVAEAYCDHLDWQSEDMGALQTALGEALGHVLSDDAVSAFALSTWDNYIEEALAAVEPTLWLERIGSAKLRSKYKSDLWGEQIKGEMQGEARKIADALSLSQRRAIALHLIIDAALHSASLEPEEPEDESVDGASSPPRPENRPTQAAPVSLNCVLVGPPGTGKTYAAVYRALDIVQGHSYGHIHDEPQRRQQALVDFEALRKAGRIDMVTFHPGYAYEDFVEGIAPVLDRQQPSTGVRYKLRLGAFRQMVERMTQTSIRRNVSDVNVGGRVWKVSLRTGNTDLTERCIYEGWVGFNYDIHESIEGSIDDFFAQRPSTSGKEIMRSFLEKMKLGDLVCVLKDQQTIQAIGVVTGDYHFVGISQPLPHRRPVRWIDRTDHDVLNLNDGKMLVAAALYELSRIGVDDLLDVIAKPEQTKPLPHVLIIDEINRGNLSRIFGELITLLEDDKRLGGVNPASVKLAYSGENFGVPKELHIIGTMNSADRSIAMMDAALRRRFDFERLDPDMSKIPEQVGGAPLRAAVTVLNRRIAASVGEDMALGHGYFMKPQAGHLAGLKDIWFKQVLPLVAEYVYGDGAKLAGIVGPFAECVEVDSDGSGGSARNYRLVSRDIDDGQFVARLKALSAQNGPA